MKKTAFCSLFLLALALFAVPTLATDSGERASAEPFVQAEVLQSIDLDTAGVDLVQRTSSASPLPVVDALLNRCSGGGGTCECEGTCAANENGCSCT